MPNSSNVGFSVLPHDTISNFNKIAAVSVKCKKTHTLLSGLWHIHFANVCLYLRVFQKSEFQIQLGGLQLFFLLSCHLTPAAVLWLTEGDEENCNEADREEVKEQKQSVEMKPQRVIEGSVLKSKYDSSEKDVTQLCRKCLVALHLADWTSSKILQVSLSHSLGEWMLATSRFRSHGLLFLFTFLCGRAEQQVLWCYQVAFFWGNIRVLMSGHIKATDHFHLGWGDHSLLVDVLCFSLTVYRFPFPTLLHLFHERDVFKLGLVLFHCVLKAVQLILTP